MGSGRLRVAVKGFTATASESFCSLVGRCVVGDSGSRRGFLTHNWGKSRGSIAQSIATNVFRYFALWPRNTASAGGNPALL